MSAPVWRAYFLRCLAKLTIFFNTNCSLYFYIMYTTYHFDSATDINSDLLKSIKAVFKGKAVVITVAEDIDETAFLMSNAENKAML